jgi:hypothetical protein
VYPAAVVSLLYLVINELFFLEYSEGSAGSVGSFSSTMTSDLLRSPLEASIISLSSLGRLLSVGLPRCLNCTPLGLVIFTVEAGAGALELF